MQDTGTTITAALRQAADLLDQNTELPQPYITTSYSGRVKAAWYLAIDHGNDHASQKAAAATIVRTVGGTWAKAEKGDDFNFSRALGLLDLVVQVDRPAVCEAVVVGTETVTIPAVEARPERTETRDKVEWRCQPLLADADEKPAVAS